MPRGPALSLDDEPGHRAAEQLTLGRPFEQPDEARIRAPHASVRRDLDERDDGACVEPGRLGRPAVRGMRGPTDPQSRPPSRVGTPPPMLVGPCGRLFETLGALVIHMTC